MTVGGHQESSFEFLDRMGGAYWAAPRQLMQEWLDRVDDDDEYRDLRERLRSKDNEQSRSAFLELYLHESLLRAGYLVTVHPKIPRTSKRPDFLAERGDERMYIEAISPGAAPAGKAAASRRAVLFDVIDNLHAPNHVLWLEKLVEGEHPPRGSRLRPKLVGWLAKLDPDENRSFDDAPSYTWSDRGWTATFKAIPKKPEDRDRPTGKRAIGIYSHTGAQIVDDAPMIRAALESKHHRYGELDAPFIIAVGTYIHDVDLWHATNALYGSLAVKFSDDPDCPIGPHEFRQPDGYFGSLPSWQNHEVSGVLLVNQLQPYSVPQVTANLWQHPNPAYPLPTRLDLPWRELAFDGRQVTETAPDTEPTRFFGLPECWPPGEAWPSVK